MSFCANYHRFLAYLCISAAISAAHASGAQVHMKNHIEISSATAFHDIHPGESGLLAITLDIQEDWHTYWPGLSDSGYGVSLDIQPTGPVSLGEIIWPSPNRYLQPGRILDHVYEESVMILVPFYVEKDASTDDVIIFDIHADYLVCKDVCIPEQGDTTATISIIESTQEKLPTSQASEIQSAFKSKPIEFNPTDDAVRVQWIPDAAAIMIQGAKSIEFYPSKECTQLFDPIGDPVVNGDRLIIKFAEKENKVLSGRLRVQVASGVVEYDIHIKPTE